MAINDLEFNQLASVLNSIHRQATGVDALTPTDTKEFIKDELTVDKIIINLLKKIYIIPINILLKKLMMVMY